MRAVREGELLQGASASSFELASSYELVSYTRSMQHAIEYHFEGLNKGLALLML